MSEITKDIRAAGIGWLLLVGIGALMAWLKVYHAVLAGPALYLLVGCGAALVIYRELGAWFRRATPGNIRHKAERWLLNAGLGVKVLPQQKDSQHIFQLHSDTPVGPQSPTVTITQLKEQPHYVVFLTRIAPSAERKEILKGAAPDALERVAGEVKLELSRAGTEYHISLPDKIDVVSRVPVTTDLTEIVFLERFERFVATVMLIHTRLGLELDRLSREMTGPASGDPATIR